MYFEEFLFNNVVFLRDSDSLIKLVILPIPTQEVVKKKTAEHIE